MCTFWANSGHSNSSTASTEDKWRDQRGPLKPCAIPYFIFNKSGVVDNKGKGLVGERPWVELKTVARNRSALVGLDRWSPPEQGWMKINVDGGYVEQTGQARVGLVVRSSGARILTIGM